MREAQVRVCSAVSHGKERQQRRHLEWRDVCPRGQLGTVLGMLMRWFDCLHDGIDLRARTSLALVREAAVVHSTDESLSLECAFWRRGSQRGWRPCFPVLSAGMMK